MKKNILFQTILILLLIGSTVSAQEKKETKSTMDRAYKNVVIKPEKLHKRSVVVVGFQAVDCDKIFADTLFNILKKEVKDSNILKFKDTDRVEMNCSNAACAVDIGKKYGVQKSIFGTITKEDDLSGGTYHIELTVVDVETGSIDIKTPTKTRKINDFLRLISDSIYTIERIYYGHTTTTGKADFDFAFSLLYPTEDIAKAAGLGYGFNLYTNVFIKRPWGMFFSFGFYGFSTKMTSIRTLYMMPLQIHVSYTFFWGLRLRFVPSIGLGYIFSYMDHDYLGYRSSGDYNYQEEFFANPIFTARTELDILVYKRLMVVVAPYYSFLVGDNSRRGHLFAFDVGLKVLF